MHSLLFINSLYLECAVVNQERATLIVYLIISGVCMLCNFMQLFTGINDAIALISLTLVIETCGFATFSSLYHEFERNDLIV